METKKFLLSGLIRREHVRFAVVYCFVYGVLATTSAAAAALPIATVKGKSYTFINLSVGIGTGTAYWVESISPIYITCLGL